MPRLYYATITFKAVVLVNKNDNKFEYIKETFRIKHSSDVDVSDDEFENIGKTLINKYVLYMFGEDCDMWIMETENISVEIC